MPIENFGEIANIYGDGGIDGTLAVPLEQFRGGARSTFAVRLGRGGTPGTYQIMDTASPSAVAVIRMTMLYPGSRPFNLTIRPTLADPDTGELLILDGTAPLERFTFDISDGADQAASLIAAVTTAGSAYFTLTKLADTTAGLANVDQAAITPGTNPYDTGGTAGTMHILDNGSTPAPVVTLTAKQQGAIPYTVSIAVNGTDSSLNDLVVSNGGATLETVSFSNAGNQITALIAAMASSNYFTASLVTDTGNGIGLVSNHTMTAPGTAPTGYSVAAYSTAFEALEAYRWNVLAIDTNDIGVQIMTQLYLNRLHEGGKFVMGVIGGDRSTAFADRLTRASSFNDYQIVYVGNGFIDATDTVYEGWMAAARISGMVAGTPSNESITHLAITGAVRMTEPLTNFQYEQAIKAGMLTFSLSAANTVWVEQGINTLVLPGTTQDFGWKKIKRVKVRFELMQRLTDTVEVLVGRVNNDPDGRMTIIQSGNGVCNAMMAERKLLAGAHCEIDPDNSPAGDSAWFLVWADDIDALEKMYFVFKFRFAPSEASA